MQKSWQKSRPKYVGNPWKSFKIHRTSFQNEPKTVRNREKCVLGAFSAPNRAQFGSRARPVVWRNRLWEPFWSKMSFQGSLSGPIENRKSLKNRSFEDRRALGPSKNGLRKGVRKKHGNLMKNRSENGRFLMGRNHVWRYTLRLFHTFAIFEKSLKNDAKREPKSHVFWYQNRPLAPKGRLRVPF